MRLTLAILFVCCSCWAQIPPRVMGDLLKVVSKQVVADVWLPTNVPNIILWYNADALVASVGDFITTWSNSCATTNNLTSSGTSKPQYTNSVSILSGKPWLWFDGNNDYMQMTTGSWPQTNTEFVLFRKYPTAAVEVVSDGSDVNYRKSFFIDASRKFTIYAGGGPAASSANAAPTNIWMLAELTWAGTASEILTNGVSVLTGDAGTMGLHGYTVGASYSLASFLHGGVAEILVFNSNVSSADRTKIRNYFTGKYGAYSTW